MTDYAELRSRAQDWVDANLSRPYDPPTYAEAVLLLLDELAEANEKLRQAAITDRALTDYFADASRRAEAAELALDAATKALRDLIPWAGKQTFENDAVWVAARAALAATEDTP